MQDVQVIDVVTGIAQTSAQALVAIAFKVLLSLLVLVIVKLVNRTIDRLLTKASQKVHPKISPLMAGFIDKVLSSVVWLLGILIVLQIWGINMAPVIAGLGITGVVLGFALQESISNIFSGLLLALNNPFGIGDYVIIGSIEGTVVSMDAFSVTLATGDRKKITMANKLVLADPIINVSSSDDRRLDMTVSVAYGSDLDRVKGIVCEYFNISQDVLLSKSRKRQIVQARQIAMYMTRQHINCSLSTIGAELGGKDHATVLHACTTVSDLMSTDRTFRQYVSDIEKMLSSGR